MADFPLFIKMDGRKVMVIGGGSVAVSYTHLTLPTKLEV